MTHSVRSVTGVKGPIFVVGASRSGTTLMSRVVSRTGPVRALAEVHFFERLYNPGQGPDQLSHDEAVELAARLVHTQHRGLFYRQGNADDYRDEAEQIVSAVNGKATVSPLAVYGEFLDTDARRRGGEVACDQTPRNVFYIRDILDAFPDARIINMVRDPRAVLLSQKNKWRRRSLGESDLPRSEVVRSWSNYHPLVTARIWRGAVDAADAVDDSRVLTVRFEDLVGDAEHQVAAVAAHCGIEFADDMLDVPQESSSLESDEPGARGLRGGVAEAWRTHGGLSDAEITLCESVAGEAMRRHDYELIAPSDATLGRIGWYAALPVKLGVAGVMNARQIGNPVTMIRRRLAR